MGESDSLFRVVRPSRCLGLRLVRRFSASFFFLERLENVLHFMSSKEKSNHEDLLWKYNPTSRLFVNQMFLWYSDWRPGTRGRKLYFQWPTGSPLGREAVDSSINPWVAQVVTSGFPGRILGRLPVNVLGMEPRDSTNHAVSELLRKQLQTHHPGSVEQTFQGFSKFQWVTRFTPVEF